MQHDRFKELLEELDGNSVATLAEKNARYSSSDDALHNFKSGADIMGGTPAQACWGYMTKHLTALRDMVERNDFSNREDFLEKCQDTINYIRFLWCIGNEGVDKVSREKFDDTDETYNRIYQVYCKSNDILYEHFVGPHYEVEVFDEGFAITSPETIPSYYSFDNYYVEEHERLGTETRVRVIKK